MQRFFRRNEKGFSNHLEMNRRTAFHEAGHAAAICLGNKRKKLPSIYFQIQVRKQIGMDSPLFTQVCGGRQIGDLYMISLEEADDKRNPSAVYSYQTAYEADIINFLVGPLAEAKYVSIRDNEAFNFHLLRPEALNNYGGNSDMMEVKSYLEFFIPAPKQREMKLNDLFSEAYRFVQHADHWKSITALAHYILDSTEENISCEQANDILEKHHQYANIHWL